MTRSVPVCTWILLTACSVGAGLSTGRDGEPVTGVVGPIVDDPAAVTPTTDDDPAAAVIPITDDDPAAAVTPAAVLTPTTDDDPAAAVTPATVAPSAAPVAGQLDHPPVLAPVGLRGPIDECPAPTRQRVTPAAWPGDTLLTYASLAGALRAAGRTTSLERRAERRAYDGAPPVMGHSAAFGGETSTCLDCHATGTRLGPRVARPMSHPPYAACQQCHVTAAPPPFVGERGAAPAANAFVGVASPGPGTRSDPGAPASMPHGLAMRGQCLACHGEFGYPGLRTDHPRRTHCTQCHLPARPPGGQALPWR